MPPRGYRSVNLPESLYNVIVKIAAKYGYTSVDDFVRDAVRRRLEELGCLK